MMLRKMKYTVIVIISLGVAVGCSPLDAKYSSKKSGGRPELGGMDNQDKPVPPVYSDFKDVLILGELEEDKRHSSVILHGETGTGFMSYYGRVEIPSIINFFSIKMPQDGWKAITVQKSPFSTIMIFSKEKRWCTITIREKGFSTEVQIGVAPEIEED